MSKDSELHDFIKRAVSKGVSFKKIDNTLVDAGWNKTQVESALKFYHESDLPVAVPKPMQIASPRLWALNIFYFGSFYVTLCTLTFAIFTLLDNFLPDGYGQMVGAFKSSNIREPLKGYLSTIIVALPLTIYSGHLIRKAIASSGQAMPLIRLRLIYLSMLIGGIITAICGILFAGYAIDGILSWRFTIKVAILLFKFGGIYLFFKPELYRSE